MIPEVFHLRSDVDHAPCPFWAGWFQWMRNLVRCREMARKTGRQPAVVVVYAEASDLAMARKIRSPDWHGLAWLVRREAIAFQAISYQRLLDLGTSVLAESGPERDIWTRLGAWISDERRVVTSALPKT